MYTSSYLTYTLQLQIPHVSMGLRALRVDQTKGLTANTCLKDTYRAKLYTPPSPTLEKALLGGGGCIKEGGGIKFPLLMCLSQVDHVFKPGPIVVGLV